MYLDINDEDDDLVDDVIDSDEGGSKLDDASDKIKNAKDKIDNARNLVEKIKNKSNKSDSQENPNAKEPKQSKTNSNSENASGGKQGTTGETGGTGTGGSGAGGTGASGAGAGGTAAGGAGTGGAAAGGAGASGAAAGGAATTGATAATAATPVGWVILIIIVVVLLILMIVGFLSFFIDGLGLITEKLLKFADGIWTSVVSVFVGKDEATIKAENIIEIGDYLEGMGYELEGYGFLNSNGKSVTTEDNVGEDGKGKRIIKNSDGEVILEREITQAEDGTITEGKITKMESNCIWTYLKAENRTYLIDNETFSIKSMWDFWFGGKHTPGAGMILITDEDGNYENSYTPWDNAVRHVSIDRERKEMIVELDNYKYSYSLDGWAGKYGKSLEFLLTLHLATMSPDFAKEVASNENFNAQVWIGLEEVEGTVTIINEYGEEITESNYEANGLTEEQWEAIDNYNGTIKTYTPYIIRVSNHWFYKDIIFRNKKNEIDVYETIENNSYPYDNTPNKDFTYIYEYVGLGSSNDNLTDNKLYIREVRKADIYQKSEPLVIKRGYKAGELSLQTILLGGDPGSENTIEDYKYHIYNGSPILEGAEREKRYIIEKLEYGENSEYAMDTKMFQYAFAILESVHTQDAEYVLRDLKELFLSLGIEFEGKDETEEASQLQWIIQDYIPVNWDPMFNTSETEMKITAKTNSQKGFEPLLNVLMPADGKIKKVSDNGDGTKTIKIEFTGEDEIKLKGKTIYLRGISSNIEAEESYERGEVIGKTARRDITVIMTNKNHSAITNVDDYLYPPEKINEK